MQRDVEIRSKWDQQKADQRIAAADDRDRHQRQRDKDDDLFPPRRAMRDAARDDRHTVFALDGGRQARAPRELADHGGSHVDRECAALLDPTIQRWTAARPLNVHARVDRGQALRVGLFTVQHKTHGITPQERLAVSHEP